MLKVSRLNRWWWWWWSRIDMRNRPRRGSRTTVTRTASLITFIKVRERQLRGGISARRKDRLDRVELTDRSASYCEPRRAKNECGNERGGSEKAGWKWARGRIPSARIKIFHDWKVLSIVPSFFPLLYRERKIHRSSSSSSSSSLFPYYMERKGETTLCAKK